MRWFRRLGHQGQPTRNRLWMDRAVQGGLIARAILYAAAATVYFLTIEFFDRLAPGGEQSIAQWSLAVTDKAVFWVPGLLVLGPLMVHDLLSLSSRFIGPVYAMRRQLRELAEGQDGCPIAFRHGDHWTGMADEFNAVRAELIELRQKLK